MSPFLTAIVLLLCLCQPHGGAAVLHRVSLDSFPGAVCSDGSPAAYYRSETRGRGAGPDVVVFLEGGGYCHDIDACEWRCDTVPRLCTAPTASTVYGRGILSDDPDINPYFHSYFKVHLPYCTSDMFIGRRPGSPLTRGQHFMGRHVLDAVVTSLELSGVKRVVFGGSSAGGAGVVFNCDHLQELLPGVAVSCVVDAAFFYPLTRPFRADVPCESIDKVLKVGGPLWNAPEVAVLDLQTWWLGIDRPVFVGTARYDLFGLESFCAAGDTSRAELDVWDDGIGEMVQYVLSSSPRVGLFVPGCRCHMMLNDDDAFGRLRVGPRGRTYGETLHAWLTASGDIHSVDTCTRESGQICRGNCSLRF